jgi:pyridoxine kinase
LRVATILVLSSYVARGHVGLRAMLPAMERLAHDVMALPTVILSSHAAFPHVAGTPVPVDVLEAMAGALEANGWLPGVQFVVTGYLPTPAHVTFAAALVDRVRQRAPGVQFVCDPVLGDEPKGIYVSEETAAAIRRELIPRASLATPNRFELGWLTGHSVTSVVSAVAAARALGCDAVLATSIPHTEGRLATVLVDGSAARFTAVGLRASVPSGTGDYLTGLFLAECAAGRSGTEALAIAGACLEAALSASGPRDDLCLTEVYGARPAPLAVQHLPANPCEP